MKRGLLVVFLALLFISARASHIVGGELALVHIDGTDYNYRIEFIMYYDRYGNTGGDPNVTVRIYRKRDHQYMNDFVLIPEGTILPPPRNAIGDSVKYFQPSCSDGSIETARVFYKSQVIYLSPDIYNDPEGYYIVWERCCRNYTITNIYSEAPPTTYSHVAGQIFYLEFPPVVVNGAPFINSSPTLFPPLSDYACPNRKYFVDFAGTDVDGDSLVYSMVAPLNSVERVNALPEFGPNPGPYDSVTWKPGFHSRNVMNGSPDLRISSDGLLTVTPSEISAGLYVFAVLCEEFRNGVKIGEVRRDFQMLVVGACPVADPPLVVGKKKGDLTYTNPNQTLSLSFPNSVADGDRCITIRVSDLDSEKFEDDYQEKIRIEVVPLNFKAKSRYITSDVLVSKTAKLQNGSTAEFDICFPECSYVPNAPFAVGIIAFDDACTLPLSDTLIAYVYVENPPNNKPQFTTATEVDETLNEGDTKIWDINAIDIDNDQMIVGVLTDGFILADVGMTFELQTLENGLVSAQLIWDTRCDVYDFSQKTNFDIKILVDDADQCLVADPVIAHFQLDVKLPGNADPLITSDLDADPNKRTIEVTKKVFEELTFDVFGSDADDDLIILSGTGVDFDAAAAGVTFTQVTGNGNVESPAGWSIACNSVDLEEQVDYTLQFIVVDNANKCRLYKADTLDVVVHVEPPDNLNPELAIVSNSHELANNALTAMLGEGPIRLVLFGTDLDTSPTKDQLIIELISADGNVPPQGFEFSTAQGESVLEASFVWDADCSIFENGIYENTYNFSFRVADDRCWNLKADTVDLEITIKDPVQNIKEFLPMNLVTPNDDGYNDYFSMENFVVDPEHPFDNNFENRVLPPDNCLSHFLGINIFNRWGKQVYESSKRDFRWHPDNLAAGVYYYHLIYSDRIFRGTVTVEY